MSKDFDTWNTYQKKLHASERPIICKPGSVWWCALGINIGHEQDADRKSLERPVVIITVFGNNTCLCVPMTSPKNENPFYENVSISGEVFYVITSQARTISTKRLLREIGSLSHRDFKRIRNKLHKIISPSKNI